MTLASRLSTAVRLLLSIPIKLNWTGFHFQAGLCWFRGNLKTMLFPRKRFRDAQYYGIVLAIYNYKSFFFFDLAVVADIGYLILCAYFPYLYIQITFAVIKCSLKVIL